MNNQQEISALCACVNEFSKEMKEELHICALRGKRGWDKMGFIYLHAKLMTKVGEYNNAKTQTQSEKLLIDIANLSMMTRKALKDGR